MRSELACLAHKSLEICDRRRLRQQNSSATPENSAAFRREGFETLCLDSSILNESIAPQKHHASPKGSSQLGVIY
jgi:hypothetical protein